jgi:ComF family protein
MMFPSRRGEDHLCGQCATTGHWFSASRAVGRYQGPLRDIIHHLKYGGRVWLARPLGLLMYAVFRTTWPPGEIDMVMPVPLHRRRFRSRGFNQAWLLLRHWPVFPDTGEGRLQRPRLLRAGLVRRRATRPQTGLGRQERLSNLEGAFALAPDTAVDDRTVLLVDDVMTTGTTVDECARVLLAAGAGRVDVLTLARAMT